MKKQLLPFLLLLLALPATLRAQEAAEDLYVYLKNGGLKVFPREWLQGYAEKDGSLVVSLRNDLRATFALSDVARYDATPPDTLPHFTSFKFNNKYNDQVFTDVFATLDGEDRVTAEVGAIGKRLTPSFQFNQVNVSAYVDGVLQQSKVSRHRFDRDITYLLAYDGWQKFCMAQTRDEVWSPAETQVERIPVALTADMLSTNAPSNYPETEDLDKMLDDDPTTLFHSTWGTGQYEKLPLTEHPFVQVDLQEALSCISFYYLTRHNSPRWPTAWSIQASNDGTAWTEVATLADGLPAETGKDYTSGAIDLGGSYTKLRFVQTAACYKNYLCLAEFRLYEAKVTVTKEPELLSPAQYAAQWEPYGREVTVHVDWLTDRATSVPAIHLNTVGNQPIADKVTYLRAYITIDGAGVFPDFADSVSVRGRGNTSWAGAYGKSPYRLKFDAKKKPFGLTAGKNWVLLANNQTGSMMTNAIAQKVARLVQTAGANDIVPVELYLNDEYRGSYNFTQQVGLSNNSVDLADDTNATLLELDSYFDETYRFRDDAYHLPVNIKEPDFEENYDEERYNLIVDHFNEFTSTLYDGGEDYTSMMDVEQFARFFFVNNYVLNCELGHPKSCYLYREDILSHESPYVFGPVWDFDWAYGYDGTSVYCQTGATSDVLNRFGTQPGGQFYRALYTQSDAVKRASYLIWKNFMEKYQQEVIEYVDDYFAFANSSFLHNAERWGDGDDYEYNKENMKQWLQTRAEHVFNNLEVYEIDEPQPIELGDVNGDGTITVSDVICVVNYILGNVNEAFVFAQADTDRSGSLTVSDVVGVVQLVLDSPASLSAQLNLPAAAATVRPAAFAAQAGSPATLPVEVTVSDEAAYAGLQFDLVLPQGMDLTGVFLPAAWEGWQARFAPSAGGRYRVVVYGHSRSLLPAGCSTLELAVETPSFIAEPQRVVSLEKVTLGSALGEDFRVSPRSAKFTMEATGITPAEAVAAEGGEQLTLHADGPAEVDIFTPDGRLVRRAAVSAGENRLALPAGVYIVNRQKVVVQ